MHEVLSLEVIMIGSKQPPSNHIAERIYQQNALHCDISLRKDVYHLASHDPDGVTDASSHGLWLDRLYRRMGDAIGAGGRISVRHS